MQVRCPHCHSPIEVADDAPLVEILCSSCGSSFSLISGETTQTLQTSARRLGHFELVRELGIGKFGSVWLARDTELDRTVAIKIPRKGTLDAEETAFFLRDARAAAQLKHPHIVGVHEVGREGDTIFIVSDCIEGANLHEWLSAERPTTRKAVELAVKIAEALDYAHARGVVHRDLKPSNIMLDRDGEPHLIDFGLAKRDAGEITITRDGHILGTPAYMSPEQAEGKGHDADRRSDVYSLGVILYELLTGRLPFQGAMRMLIVQITNSEPPRLRKHDARIPRDLETITLKCLEKDPLRRYQTAAELADDLKHWLRGEPIRARPVSRIERAWRWSRRNRALATLVALNVVAVTALLVVFMVRSTAEDAGHSQALVLNTMIDSGDLVRARQFLQESDKQRPELMSSELLQRGRRRLDEAESAESRRREEFAALLSSLSAMEPVKIGEGRLTRLGDLAKSWEEMEQVLRLRLAATIRPPIEAVVDSARTRQPPPDVLPDSSADRGPFAELPSAFSLPERPDSMERAGDMLAIPGHLHEAVLDRVEMALDSSLCDLDGRRFVLAPIKLSGKRSRSWGIRIAEGESQPAVAIGDNLGIDDVAMVSITNERKIGFQWSHAAWRPQAEQLCNAVLLLSHGSDRHAVAFRRPQAGAPMRLDLRDGSIEVPIEIDTPPLSDRLYCEVLSLDNLASGESRPVLESDAKTLPLDDKTWGRITLPPLLAFDLAFLTDKESKERSWLTLQLSSRYSKEGKTWVSFKGRDLKLTLQRLQRDIAHNVRDLSAHVATYRESMAALPRVQADANRAMTGKVNPAEATAANSRVQSVMKAIRASENGIKRLTRSLPNSYEALGKLYELAVLGEQLRQAGQIQFRIVAKSETAQVTLVSCQGEPPRLTRPIVVEGFSMDPAGSWFQVRGDVFVYDLEPDGKCSVRSPMLDRPVSGQWSEQNHRVRLSAGSVSDEFEMVSPFQLRGVNGSLYRVLQ